LNRGALNMRKFFLEGMMSSLLFFITTKDGVVFYYTGEAIFVA
jgi:hypothetical protein